MSGETAAEPATPAGVARLQVSGLDGVTHWPTRDRLSGFTLCGALLLAFSSTFTEEPPTCEVCALLQPDQRVPSHRTLIKEWASRTSTNTGWRDHDHNGGQG